MTRDQNGLDFGLKTSIDIKMSHSGVNYVNSVNNVDSVNSVNSASSLYRGATLISHGNFVVSATLSVDKLNRSSKPSLGLRRLRCYVRFNTLPSMSV